MSKVSIIVPIYGVEKYIERCARSLFEQTFNDIEYIFVNDFTKDASIDVLLSVIDDYPHRKKQTKILSHNKNKGLPQARKTGILAATSEYLINFDSDDWVDKRIIEILYKKALDDASDIVICDISTSDGINNRLVRGGDAHLSKMDLFKQMCQMNFTWSTCNKLIKRSLFDDVTYPIYNNAEDMALTLQLIAKADKLSYVPQSLYFYYINPQSMTRVQTEERIRSIIKEKNENIQIVYQVLNKVFTPDEYNKFIEVFKWQVKKLAWQMLKIDKIHYGYWKSLYSEINFTLFFNPYISFEDKLKCVLTHLSMYPRR